MKIVYPGVPSRFNSEKFDEIISFIRGQNHAPVNYRNGFLYDDFEHKLGREKTLDFFTKIMLHCDAFWVFGCSNEVMNKWKLMLDNKADGRNIRVYPEFDPDWQSNYESFAPKFGDLLKRTRAKQKLFAFIGPRTIGKTFWIDRLIKRFEGDLSQVKTNTNREPRGDADFESYNFWTTKEFEQGINDNMFFEYDNYHGIYYGSTFSEIYKVFDRGRHGILALTPPGILKFFEVRDKINLSVICLKPESEEVMLKNFDRRNITNEGDRKKYMEESKNFVPPNGVEYKTVWISGDIDTDEARLTGALEL